MRTPYVQCVAPRGLAALCLRFGQHAGGWYASEVTCSQRRRWGVRVSIGLRLEEGCEAAEARSDVVQHRVRAHRLGGGCAGGWRVEAGAIGDLGQQGTWAPGSLRGHRAAGRLQLGAAAASHRHPRCEGSPPGCRPAVLRSTGWGSMGSEAAAASTGWQHGSSNKSKPCCGTHSSGSSQSSRRMPRGAISP